MVSLHLLHLLCLEAGVANPNPRKRKKQALKIGHGGTLDSAASGVLGKGTTFCIDMKDAIKFIVFHVSHRSYTPKHYNHRTKFVCTGDS